MKLEITDWEEDLPADPEEEYQALVRALKRAKGFNVLFIRCSPAVGEQIIKNVKQDITHKIIEVLRLEEPIDNLYNILEQLPNKDKIDVLFIKGLEKSFTKYIKPGYGGQGDYYKLDTVPPILGHLNLQRERVRDNFNICFVFLLPLFGLKYFIRRSPDFFDWRSGVFEFPTDAESVEKESLRVIGEGDYEKYLTLTPEERSEKIIEIQELLEEDHQTPSYRASLFFELGNLLAAAKEYAAALASYDQALKFKPDLHEAWYNRGIVLGNLGRYEEALASYDQALKFKLDHHEAWNNRGIALRNLGRYEEALASYDQALKFKLDHHEAWYNRGIALRNLGRDEEALASYDQALKFKPDYHTAWYNR
ncbi:MAG: tetratricopeptide repeat protein, partial [Aphanothece sp. CMT-3BRIN-NPC111]|nr:tetratricopeptide repeat protein [Aphanothece sp. CMT-3BRIN-NPC111]